MRTTAKHTAKWLSAELFFFIFIFGRAEASSLTLAGTVVGTGARSAAVFNEDNQQYLLYEGDMVGAAVIEKVENDRVILAAAGKRAILLLNGGRVEQDAESGGSASLLPPDLMPPPPPPAPMPAGP
ncbi:MAG: type II secretion system protein N [Candidatus Electronema sp. V4]|uniref:type II secretion system protein N n=1 Tax=Candidatus Electronema sp. V4 TaxID=3454756 RepID=UPI0040557A7C